MRLVDQNAHVPGGKASFGFEEKMVSCRGVAVSIVIPLAFPASSLAKSYGGQEKPPWVLLGSVGVRPLVGRKLRTNSARGRKMQLDIDHRRKYLRGIFCQK